MLLYRTVLLSILVFVYLLNLTAQDTPLEVYVHDSYTDHPLESALVSVLLNGVVIDSAYTSINGIATLSGVTSVREPVGLPTSITLSHNYPNPFSDDTNVEIGIPEAQTITATVYNILGQRVASEQLPVAGGYYTLNLSLGHLPTGVYFLRIEGRESQAIKLLKMGRGVHPSGPVFSISGSSFPGGATIGKSTGDEYTVRAVKDRYDVYEAVLEQPLRSGVVVPLARNNIVEFVVVDGDNNPVTKQLEIKMHDYQTTITTPYTLTLKSGVYRALGEVEEGISLERTVEIPSVDTTVVLSYEESGVMLEGAPDAPAIDATYDLIIPIVYPEEAISIDPDLLYDGRVLRTEIEVILDPDVTIADVNDLLNKYDAQIVSMLQNNTIFILRVPDPGDIASLNQLIAEIESEDIVLFILKSIIVGNLELASDSSIPGGTQVYPIHVHDKQFISHHLAVRAHAAWNLRNAITELNNRPWIVIADKFGDGAPGKGYNASLTNTDFATGNTHLHGYHTLGIITGMYDEVEGLTVGQNYVTGIFPEQLRVRAVDLRSRDVNTWPRRLNSLITRINEIIESDSDAKIIINTSLSSRHYENQMPTALSWIKKVRGNSDYSSVGADLESRFIHFTSAGNRRNGAKLPIEISLFAYAALGDITSDGNKVPNLTNIFVVENRVNTPHDENKKQRPLPGCAFIESYMGGNLSAMGHDIWSFGECLGKNEQRECILHASYPHTSFQAGTSMATAQAAGVAAYVWSINPDLSVSEVMDIIRNTAEIRAINNTPGFQCNDIIPQPVVDVYAAVLAAGKENARRVMLDISSIFNGESAGKFVHDDIELFLEAISDPGNVGKLRYSRIDFNGDGITGGGSTDRFDLNMDGEYSVVEQNIEGRLIPFDENELTDIEILCYYAYSDLYQGSSDRRGELLDGLCGVSGGYKVVTIGSQIWMAENLRTRTYSNGEPIPHLTSIEDWINTESGAYTIMPHAGFDDINSEEEMLKAYGAYYNWYAVDDERGLCPDGWRVPSRDDWEELIDYLGGRAVAGGKMKSTRTDPDPHPRWHPLNQFYATNESGFSGLPAGYTDGTNFYWFQGAGFWWSSTRLPTIDRAFAYVLGYDSRAVGVQDVDTWGGLSVRCIRDE